MSYELGQYDFRGQDVDPVDPNNNFMSAFDSTNFIATSMRVDESSTDFPFKDKVLQGTFQSGKSYYFHCLIKTRTDTPQTFDVKLVQKREGTQHLQQHIKNISIGKGNGSWVNEEFVFTPTADYDSLFFELNRDSSDYKQGERLPAIIFQELSEINNNLTSITGIIDPTNIDIVKIGVQSRPGFLMCINQEDIRIGRTGIYELKTGLIPINFFSIVNGTHYLNENILPGVKTEVEDDLDDFCSDPDDPTIWDPYIKDPNVQPGDGKGVRCIFNNSSGTVKRTLDSFTVDYLCRREGS